jgi:hypothetical protein
MTGSIPDTFFHLKEGRLAIPLNSGVRVPIREWLRRKKHPFHEENLHPDFWNQAGRNSCGNGGMISDGAYP